MKNSEKLLIVQTLGVIVFTSWAFGGRVSWAPPWIMGLALLAVVPLFLSFRDSGPEPDGSKDKGLRGLLLLPWLLLFVLIGVSYFNPSFEPMPPEMGPGLIAREHNENLPSTVSPARTLEIAGLLAAVLFQSIVVFRVFQRRRAIQRLLALLCLNALIMGIGGTAAYLLGAEKMLGFGSSSNPAFFATFPYRNHWAAFALLALCTAVGLLFHYLQARRHQLTKTRGTPLPFFIAALLLLAVTIPMPGSRSGMALLLVLILALSGRTIAHILTCSNLRAGKRAAALGLLTITTLGFLVYGYFLAQTGIQRAVDTTGLQWGRYLETGYFEARIPNSQLTWKMARDQPVWGWGLGTFPLVSPAYHGDRYRHPTTGEIQAYLIDAHNDWLQFLAELGWTGFSLLLLTPVLIYALYFFKGKGNPLSRWCFLGCGLLLIYGAGDFPFQNPAVFLLFAVIFAAATKYGLLERERTPVDADKEL